MRRKDKLLHITRLNKTLTENIQEHHTGEYGDKIMSMTIADFLDALKVKDKTGYEVVEKVIEQNFVESADEGITGLPADMEIVDESEPTDVNKSQWFSDTDGERITDKCMDC